jgi:hypothetical protein
MVINGSEVLVPQGFRWLVMDASPPVVGHARSGTMSRAMSEQKSIFGAIVEAILQVANELTGGFEESSHGVDDQGCCKGGVCPINWKPRRPVMT